MDIKIPFGLRDNKIIHISDITEDEKGLRCRCICPQCHSILIAKLGDKNVHHFAHQNVDCPFGLETALHLFAKQVLEETKYIRLPEVAYYWQGRKNVLYPESSLYFDAVAIERRIGNIIPDIILRKGNSELIVEIKVTHEIDSDKFDKIFSFDISTVEIDLSSFDKTNFDKVDVTRAIIHGLEYKEWIYNSKAMAEEEKQQRLYEKEKAERDIQRAKEEAALLSKLNQKLDRVKRLLDADNIALLRERWDKDIANDPLWLGISKDLNINLSSLPEYLNYEIEGELVFNCDRRIWQALLFRVFYLGSKFRAPYVAVKSVIEWLKKKPSQLPLNWDLIYLKDLEEYQDYPGLADVICEFFLVLTKNGFMMPTEKTLKTRGSAFYWWFERLVPDTAKIFPYKIPVVTNSKSGKLVLTDKLLSIITKTKDKNTSIGSPTSEEIHMKINMANEQFEQTKREIYNRVAATKEIEKSYEKFTDSNEINLLQRKLEKCKTGGFSFNTWCPRVITMCDETISKFKSQEFLYEHEMQLLRDRIDHLLRTLFK